MRLCNVCGVYVKEENKKEKEKIKEKRRKQCCALRSENQVLL